jgi:hypothetical protein
VVYGGGGAAAARAAQIANAIKASGILVQVSPEDFLNLVTKMENPLVIVQEGKKWWESGAQHKYLVGFRGFVFYTGSDEPLSLDWKTEIIRAERIWIPG